MKAFGIISAGIVSAVGIQFFVGKINPLVAQIIAVVVCLIAFGVFWTVVVEEEIPTSKK